MAIIIISLIVSVFLESTITTLPLVLLLILFASVIVRKNEVFPIAFFAGLLLDILSLQKIGFSSLYFVTFVFVIYLYQKKFEIETLNFITIFSFLGSFGYLFMVGTRFVFLQSLVAAVFAIILFIAFKKSNKKVPKYV